jgi:hypothetical protein
MRPAFLFYVQIETRVVNAKIKNVTNSRRWNWGEATGSRD